MGEGGAVPGEEMVEFFNAIDRLRAGVTSERSPKQLGRDLIQLRQAIDLLEVEFSELAARFAASEEWEAEGSVSPIDWIRHQCKMSGAHAADRLCVGELASRLPLSMAAVAEGRIGLPHLTLLARTASALERSPSARAFDEVPLLAQAEEVSVGRFWHLCQHAKHAHDEIAFAADELDAVERRSLSFSACEDGMVLLKGVLDSLGGATLRTALEPLATLKGVGDERLRERRLADALVELAGHCLDRGALPQRASQRPHLQVTASLETLLGASGAPAGDVEFSLPVSARAVERLSCDGSLTRVLLSPESVVIDVGRARRAVSGPTRRALEVRDQHCQWPGCDRPASWTAAHHLVHWARDGRTDLANLVLLCHRHHWLVHEGRWQLVRTDDGRLLTIPPPSLYPYARGPDLSAAA